MATPALSLCESTLEATGSAGPQPGAGNGVGTPGNVGQLQELGRLCSTREKPKCNSRIRKVGHNGEEGGARILLQGGGPRYGLLPLPDPACPQVLPGVAEPQAALWFLVSPSESTTLASFWVHVLSGHTDTDSAGSRRSGTRTGALAFHLLKTAACVK